MSISYPFSQLISEIYQKLQGLRAQVYEYTPSEHNAADFVNFHTEGGAILANYIVPPPQRIQPEYAVVVAPHNSAQNSRLQLRKKGR